MDWIARDNEQNLSLPPLADSDPRVEVLYSAKYQQLILRRPIVATVENVTGIAGFYVEAQDAKIAAEELGEWVLRSLSRTVPDDKQASSAFASSKAPSREEFEEAFWPFVIWTKDDAAAPFVLASPVSDYHSTNPKLVAKSVTARTLGQEIWSFIREVERQLRLCRLPGWVQTGAD